MEKTPQNKLWIKKLQKKKIYLKKTFNVDHIINCLIIDEIF